jgi:guanylate kinase
MRLALAFPVCILCRFNAVDTTRSPRPGEANGKEYHFVKREQFQSLIAENAFIEHTNFSGNVYGTSIAAIEAVKNDGKICLLDIDRQGVLSVKNTQMNARFVFIKPPSLQILEQRLRARATESEESLQRRLHEVQGDLDMASQPGIFDIVIINDDLDKAYGELKSFIQSHYKL